MKTGIFLELLEKNPSKELVFEYRENEFVPNAYHITEIKNQHTESVDCGGFAHTYDQTVVQLWISGTETKTKGMDVGKALKIFNIVDKKVPMKRDTEIFFEWGFDDLPTSTYKIQAVENKDDQIILKLFVPKTVCKPRELLETVQKVTGTSCCGDGEKVGELMQAARKCC